MNKIICKIFWHFFKTETTIVFETKYSQTYNYKDTCKLCGKIEEWGYTMCEWPTIELKKEKKHPFKSFI